MTNTIITADQAIYDIAFGLKSKIQPDDQVYSNLILIIGLSIFCTTFSIVLAK